MGRLGARRHGCLHLRAGAGAGAHGAASALGRCGLASEHRLLRQHPAGHVPARLGPVDGVGTHQRSHRPRARADADDSLLLAVHVSVRSRHQHLAACAPARARGYRHRRRAAGRRGVSGGGAVREPAEDRRRLDAHRVLLRLLLRVGGQLFHRREFRMEVDVHFRRPAGAVHRLHPVQRTRIGEVERALWRQRPRAPEDAASPSRPSSRPPTGAARW